jgi:hypothetical protein
MVAKTETGTKGKTKKNIEFEVLNINMTCSLFNNRIIIALTIPQFLYGLHELPLQDQSTGSASPACSRLISDLVVVLAKRSCVVALL